MDTMLDSDSGDVGSIPARDTKELRPQEAVGALFALRGNRRIFQKCL